MTNPQVSVILPFYKQADHIWKVISDYEEALSKLEITHETILVINGTSESLLEIAQKLSSEFPNVRYIYSKTAGWGSAVRLGLKDAQGDFLCYTNSARTPPDDLMLSILYGIANVNAITKTHRVSRETMVRKIGSFIFNLLGRILFGLPTWDINATPKVFSRQTYNSLNLTEDGDLIDLEFFIQCKQLRKPILELPIYGEFRYGGKSTTTYKSAIKMYMQMFRIWHNINQNNLPT